jgi:hypothetical protein
VDQAVFDLRKFLQLLNQRSDLHKVRTRADHAEESDDGKIPRPVE